MCLAAYVHVLRVEYLAVACAQRSAILWHSGSDEMLKAPWGSRVHRVIGLTSDAIAVKCKLRNISESGMCLCFLSSLRVLGGLIDSRQHHCFAGFGFSLSPLQMLEKLGSNHGFLGMDRKPHSFPLSLCCVIRLWNDGIMVHCAHFQLPCVLAQL